MKRFLFLTLAAGFLGLTPLQAAEKNPVVVMETSMGTIKIELFADKAPITVKNFLDYVDDGHFDGLIFHRVIPGFMIQGGGFDSKMSQKKTAWAAKNWSRVLTEMLPSARVEATLKVGRNSRFQSARRSGR